MQKVADGIHRPAIFNMRMILAEMPRHLLITKMRPLDPERFFKLILTSNAWRRDRRFNSAHRRRIETWQRKYLRLVQKVSTPHNIQKLLQGLAERAASINREDRMTGNALINIVEEILKFRKKGADRVQIQALIDEFIDHQTFNPDFRDSSEAKSKPAPVSLLHTLLTVTYGYREDI